jgi:hypothetical protein
VGLVVTAAVIFGALSVTGLGCELIATVDRSLIDGVDAGTSTGGSGSVSSSSSSGMMAGTGGMAGAGGVGGTGVGTGGTGGAMPTCMDGMQNGAETDADCGGSTCPKCMDGDTCAGNSDCMSDNCMAGTCAPPLPTCTDGTQNGAESDVDCGGSTCPKCMDGQICGADIDCASNNCMAGTCAAPPATCLDGMQNGMETGLDCGGPICPTCANGETCGGNSDCMSDYCKAGTCSAKDPNGTACADASSCASGFCADGFCCVTACSGTCQTCAQAEGSPANGTCSNVANNTDPNDSCADDGPAGCGNNGLCNSAGQCRKYAAGTACGDMQSCMGGFETKQDTCNGFGTCTNNGTVNCGAYACGPLACLTMCSDPADCIPGAVCNNGLCKKSNGQNCTTPTECDSGMCVDGFCCNATCTTACMSCNVVGNVGTCSNVPLGLDDSTCGGNNTCNGMGTCLLDNDQPCTMNSECASNNCDGTSMLCAP